MRACVRVLWVRAWAWSCCDESRYVRPAIESDDIEDLAELVEADRPAVARDDRLRANDESER